MIALGRPQLLADPARLILLPLGLVATAAITWLFSANLTQQLVAAVIFIALAALALTRPKAAIVATFVFLAVLGDLRRIVLISAGPVANDPILLVAPATALLLAGSALLQKRLSLSSTCARLVLALMALMTLQIVNPLQGGLQIGLAGGLFYIVPLFWFWVGLAWGNEDFVVRILQRVVLPLAFAAALLGIYQALVGLLPFEDEWVRKAGYAALYIEEGRIRCFSFFPSATEFAHYTAAGIIVGLAAGTVAYKRHLLLFLPVMCLAVFLEGSRGVLVTLLLAIGLVWAIKTRIKGAALIFKLATTQILLGLGLAIALIVASGGTKTDTIAAVARHQGLVILNPIDSSESTVGGHLQLIYRGIVRGIVNPVGYGLGAGTMAARTGSDLGGTEFDVSNVSISLGILGVVLYCGVASCVASTLYKRNCDSTRFTTVAIIGILVLEAGQWLTGAHYAVTAVIWFCIGASDRAYGVD